MKIFRRAVTGVHESQLTVAASLQCGNPLVCATSTDQAKEAHVNKEDQRKSLLTQLNDRRMDSVPGTKANTICNSWGSI